MNYYNVVFKLSDGRLRTLKDIKAETHESAQNKAIKSENADKIVIEIKDTVYNINRNHIVEIVIEKVDSPEDRSKQQKQNMDALKNIF